MKTRKNVSLKVALMMLVLLFSFMTSTAQTKKNNMVYDVVEVLDKEAVRVVKSMPKWSPGKQKGKPVRVRFNLPVMFKLN